MPNRLDDFDRAHLEEVQRRRARPYDGQSHTDLGVRGKTLVEGLTMRDVRDCMVEGMFLASGLSREEWPDNVYELPWDHMDPIACVQNAMCMVEKMMGIFPNIPRVARITDYE